MKNYLYTNYIIPPTSSDGKLEIYTFRFKVVTDKDTAMMHSSVLSSKNRTDGGENKWNGLE